MATHGEIRWPPVGTFGGRLRGDSHGRRHRHLDRAAGSGGMRRAYAEPRRPLSVGCGAEGGASAGSPPRSCTSTSCSCDRASARCSCASARRSPTARCGPWPGGRNSRNVGSGGRRARAPEHAARDLRIGSGPSIRSPCDGVPRARLEPCSTGPDRAGARSRRVPAGRGSQPLLMTIGESPPALRPLR
jgi:hypothetical protein